MKEKIDYITKKATIFIGLLAIILTNFLPIVAYAADLDKDEFVYLSDISNKIVSKNVAFNEFYIDKNEPGNLISLIVKGEKTYFLKGLFAHANSTVIYDISEYTEKGFDTFSAYIGVDTYAGSNGNGVKFTISVSNDKEKWTDVKTSSILKGDTESQKISISISDYKYLKLYADNNGNASKDHAVYADAMVYNSKTYTPKESTNIEWIKRLSEYNKDIENYNITDIVSNNDLRLKVLQRTLVSRVDYYVLQAWANASTENEELLEWLFKDVDRLEEYILGGSPLGGNYVKSLTILSDLYKEHKEDLSSTYGKTFQKLMFAISLTHTQDVSSWFAGANGARVYSTPLGRYEAIKELFIGAAENKYWDQKTNDGTPVRYVFNWQQFQDLTVEEMRWVTDTKLSDEEFLWLNWYATITKLGKTEYSGMNNGNGRGELNPYTYINYGDGGQVGRDDYYTESPMCGVGNEFYNPNKRTSNCYDKYQLNDWPSLKTQTKAKPTLWIAFEEDGVCGTLMHVGVNLEGVFGTPAEGLGQPGHGAYIYANREYSEEKERYITSQWNTYNWVSNWDQSEKGERLLLNWGTRNKSTVFKSTYNLIYIPLAQKALNDYENYRIAELYMLLSESKPDNKDKEECYHKALEYIPYHITAWYNLLTLKVNNPGESGINTSELSELGKEMMRAVGNAPMAIEELSNIIINYLGSEIDSYKNTRTNILTALKNASNDEYMNASGVQAVAKRLLGGAGYEPIASFSFDDNILRLNSTVNDTFYYALDYNKNPSTNEVTATWKEVIGKQVDLTDRLSEITADGDIAVYIIGDSQDSAYVIDITDTAAPSNLYANDLENKVIGATNTMEWKHANTNEAWTQFTNDTKFEGAKSILVRYGAHGTTLASESVALSFELDPEADPTKVYIPISRLSAIASSQQNNNEAAIKAIDGHPKTYWHNRWDGNDKARWIRIEITDGPVELSKIEYMPRQDTGTNGIYLTAKIEVSLTGNDDDWTVVDDNVVWGNNKSTKTYIFEKPTLAKYVRLTALSSVGNFASASMINLYENTVTNKVSVDDLDISYITSGYVYNGQEKTPSVTVKNGEVELINGEHYTIEYANNVNAGTGKIIITGLGIYNGTRTLEFTILKAKEPNIIPENEMVATVSQDYLRDLLLPANWAWLDPDTILEAGKTISVIAIYNGSDKDNYETIEIPISITKEKGNSPKITLKDGAQLTFDISKDEPKDLEYFKSLVEISDEEDDFSDLVIQIDARDWNNNWSNAGTYHIVFTVTDTDGNVTVFTLEFTLINGEDTRIEINNPNFITIDATNLEYTGNALEPNVIVVDSQGHVLKLGTDYKVTYRNNTNAGTATITITGIGIYFGEVTKEFTIAKSSTPAIIPDKNLSVSSSTSSLSDINLPEGWRWEDETIELHDGENILRIIYSGDANHESYTMEITVVKDPKPEVEDPDDNKPEEPEQEEKPSNPSEPKDPDQTEIPDKPKEPEIGDAPENPDVSVEPSYPEVSDGPSDDSSSTSIPSSSTSNSTNNNHYASSSSTSNKNNSDSNNNEEIVDSTESSDDSKEEIELPKLKDDNEEVELPKLKEERAKRNIIIGNVLAIIVVIGGYLALLKRKKKR